MPRLLLLSATPVTWRPTTHLGLLHLLDRDLYRWEDQASFLHRFDLRKQLASAVYALDADFESLLGTAIDEIAEMVPEDALCRVLGNDVRVFLTEERDLTDETQRPDLRTAVEALRAHISETYRLHRRTVRHRRSQVLHDAPDAEVMPYEVRGRSAPQALSVQSAEHQLAQDLLSAWQTGVSNSLRDKGEALHLPDYGPALPVLLSRAGGPASDVADALRFRLLSDDTAAERAGLSEEERAGMRAPGVLEPESQPLELLDGVGSGSGISALVDVFRPIVLAFPRIVILCGPGSLAEVLCEAVRIALGEQIQQFQPLRAAEGLADPGEQAEQLVFAVPVTHPAAE